MRLLYKFTGEEINPLFCQQQNPELFELFLRLHKNILSDKFKYKYKRYKLNKALNFTGGENTLFSPTFTAVFVVSGM